MPPIRRACQEAPRKSRRGFVEASNRACLIGDRVGRHRSRSSAHCSISTEGSELRIAEDAGGDRRALAGTIRVDGHTPRGSQNSHGFGDDGGYKVGTDGSVDRRSRKQTTSCGGWVEFSMLVRSRRCSARYGLRGVRGEASHPGPSFIRLRRATSLVNVASTQVDSGRFAAAPTLLDSLTEDLSMAPPHFNLGEIGPVGVRSPRGADADDCSSVSSESCWGEMEDIRDDEVVEWGVLPHPPQAGPDSVVHALHST